MCTNLKIGDIKKFEFKSNGKDMAGVGMVTSYIYDKGIYTVVLLDGSVLSVYKGSNIRYSRVQLNKDLRVELDNISKFYIKGDKCLKNNKMIEGNNYITEGNTLLNMLIQKIRFNGTQKTKEVKITEAKDKLETYLIVKLEETLLRLLDDRFEIKTEVIFQQEGLIDVTIGIKGEIGINTLAEYSKYLSNNSIQRKTVYDTIKRIIGLRVLDDDYIWDFNETLQLKDLNNKEAIGFNMNYSFTLNTGYGDIVSNMDSIIKELKRILRLKVV